MVRYSRLIACLMVIGILLCAFSSCKKETGDTQTSDTTKSAETTGPQTDENGFILDSLPDTLKFGNATINFLMPSEQVQNIYVDENATNLNTIKKSIVERNRKVEERLGVKFNFITKSCSWDTMGDFCNAVMGSIMTNSQEYDIIGSYNLAATTLVLNGAFTNMSNLQYLDFDMPWWSQGIREQVEMDGKIYICAGSVCHDLIRQMYVLFFNKAVLEDVGVDKHKPYDLYLNGKWTIDEYVTICKAAYKDLNGNQTADNDDRFGMIFLAELWTSPFISSYDLKITEIGEDGYPYLTYGSARVVDAVQSLCSIIHGDPAFKIIGDTNTSYNIFMSGRSAFISCNIGYNEYLQDVDFDYGIVPYPKSSEDQTETKVFLGNGHTLFGIPIDAKNDNMSAAVLECLASEGYRKITPVYFEQVLKYRYASDDIVAKVYDTMIQNVDFQFGLVWRNNFEKLADALFRECVGRNDPNWVSKWQSWEAKFEKSLSDIVAKLKQLP